MVHKAVILVAVKLLAVCAISISREGSVTTPTSSISESSDKTSPTSSLALVLSSRREGGAGGWGWLALRLRLLCLLVVRAIVGALGEKRVKITDT